jgi:hypothetical protein
VSVADVVSDARWSIAEAHLIARHAYKKGIDVEAAFVLDRLELWRGWYYGIVPISHFLGLTGVHPIPPYGK